MVKSQYMIKTIDNTAYEIIPTEKGYAYLICLLTAVNLMTMCHMNSVGVIYNDFLNDHGGGVSNLTVASGLMQWMLSISGVIVTILLKKFTLRTVGIWASICVTSGWFLNAFISNVFQFVITYSIIQGLGLGMVITVSLTVFNQYFVERRMMMFSLCMSINSLGMMAFPPYIEHTLQEYGFRGSILIMSAIVSHTVFGMISMHPVEWHSRWRPIYSAVPQEENSVNYTSNQGVIDVEIHYKEAKLMTNQKEEKPTGIWAKFCHLFEFSLMSDRKILSILLGCSTVIFSDAAFTAIFPVYFLNIGMGVSELTNLQMIMSICEGAARICMVFSNIYLKISGRCYFMTGLIFTLISRFVFIQNYARWSTVLSLSTIGFMRSFIQITIPLILAEYNQEKFTALYALFSFISGNLNLVVMPLIGWITDYSGSYTLTFYILIIFGIPCLVLWSYEFFYDKQKNITDINDNEKI